MLGHLGLSVNNFLIYVANFFKLCVATAYWGFVAPLRGAKVRVRAMIHQMVICGYDTLPIVALIAFLIGIILAMQAAYQLRQFGALNYVAALVGVSIVRELGPLITAIIVSGRVGAAYAAEIGTMRVSEEIDALSTMGLNPVGFLVVPRFIALSLMLPCLTVLGNMIGIIGGYLMGVFNLGLSSSSYILSTWDAISFKKDLMTGLFKSFIFAMIIAQIGCNEGFNVEGGAEGVGKATTSSVVYSIFLIILADCFFTAIFYLMDL